MGRIAVRFSDDEEATLRHHMKLAGETNISAYVRRVCLEGAHPVNPALGSLHKQVDSLVIVVGRSHKLLGALATQRSENLELKNYGRRVHAVVSVGRTSGAGSG